MKENKENKAAEVSADAAVSEDIQANDAKPDENATGCGEVFQLTKEQIEEAKARVESLMAERDEMKNTAQRVQADFDNFRRRNASVRADSLADGRKEAIEAILPAMDSLERALSAADSDESGLAAGVRLVKRQFDEALAKLGVTPIECAGQPFDPNFHNAVMSEQREGVESSMVLEELQKGYMIGDKVLRYSMVKVSV